MRPQLGNAVGHTVLSWSNEDRAMLTVEKMAQHAREYMQKMGIKNTQYVTVLHTDKKHPHVHIVYNRVNNEGKTIDNFNHWHKSRKICRDMTERNGYHMGKGKAQVNRQALKGSDKLRYAIHDALTAIMGKTTSWKQVENLLAKQGIGIQYKYRSGTNEVQGISFEKDGVKFKGSAIDRRFSFAGMDRKLNENRTLETTQPLMDTRPLAEQIREIIGQKPEQPALTYEPQGWGLLDALLDGYEPPAPETMDEAERRRRKRKKQEAQSRGLTR